MNSEYLEDIIVRISIIGYTETYSFVYSRRENIWIVSIHIWEINPADILRSLPPVVVVLVM